MGRIANCEYICEAIARAVDYPDFKRKVVPGSEKQAANFPYLVAMIGKALGPYSLGGMGAMPPDSTIVDVDLVNTLVRKILPKRVYLLEVQCDNPPHSVLYWYYGGMFYYNSLSNIGSFNKPEFPPEIIKDHSSQILFMHGRTICAFNYNPIPRGAGAGVGSISYADVPSISTRDSLQGGTNIVSIDGRIYWLTPYGHVYYSDNFGITQTLLTTLSLIDNWYGLYRVENGLMAIGNDKIAWCYLSNPSIWTAIPMVHDLSDGKFSNPVYFTPTEPIFLTNSRRVKPFLGGFSYTNYTNLSTAPKSKLRILPPDNLAGTAPIVLQRGTTSWYRMNGDYTAPIAFFDAPRPLNDMCYGEIGELIGIGDNFIIKSKDRGATWSEAFTPVCKMNHVASGNNTLSSISQVPFINWAGKFSL